MAAICIVWVEALLIGSMVLAVHVKEIDFIQPEEDASKGWVSNESNVGWDGVPVPLGK